MCPAVHMSTRNLLRSSSTHEPSDPPSWVIFSFRLFVANGACSIACTAGTGASDGPCSMSHSSYGSTPEQRGTRAKVIQNRRRAPGAAGPPAAGASALVHQASSLVLRRARGSARGARRGAVSICATRHAHRKTCSQVGNDPSAGSPTETLLRLLLPLNDQVWSSFR